MAYYITNNKAEAEAYNTAVTVAHGYNMQDTVKWADVIEHPNGNQFAIQSAAAVNSSMELLEELPSDWTPEETI
jgi:hypothetical protein